MKFRLKITLCMVGLLSILFGVGGSLLITSSFHAFLEREKETAYNAYQMVLGTLQIVNSVNPQSEYKDISYTLEQLSRQNSGLWMAMQLYTAADSIYEYNSDKLVKPREPVTPGKCILRYFSTDLNRHTLILSGALKASNEILYLDMAYDISSLFETRQIQEQTYQWVFLLLSVLCALLSYTVSRVLTSPLASLSKASKAISTGQLSDRAHIYSKDEIGLVAHDFNTMAETLETTISELKDSVKRQEVFISSFTHEVKTPLTSIIGYADLIRGQRLDMEEQIEAANYIVTEGKRLENLAQKLLDILVLKKAEITFLPVHLNSLVEGLAVHLEPIYKKQGITLSCECEDGVCLMEPDLIKSLLVNLWDNARKAMEGQGGRIGVQTKMLSDGCQILVWDNGRGIPSDSLNHLTEAFYRVDKSRARKQGGVGLGLALCQKIVSLHNGSIRFESQVGKGTTVIIELRCGIT